MTSNIRLIVLSLTKFKENSVVLHCLTEEYGRRSFLVSLGKGTGMSTFLPLNILEADIIGNPKSQLWRAKNFSPLHSLFNIRNNLYKNTIALFMSEVLYRTVREGVLETGLFDWCRNSILTLDALENDFSNFHLRFLMEFAKVLGFAPDLEGLMPFSGERLADIRTLLETGLAETLAMPLNGQRRNEIAEILLQYIGYHSGCTLNIQSLKVLREVFVS